MLLTNFACTQLVTPWPEGNGHLNSNSQGIEDQQQEFYERQGSSASGQQLLHSILTRSRDKLAYCRANNLTQLALALAIWLRQERVAQQRQQQQQQQSMSAWDAGVAGGTGWCGEPHGADSVVVGGGGSRSGQMEGAEKGEEEGARGLGGSGEEWHSGEQAGSWGVVEAQLPGLYAALRQVCVCLCICKCFCVFECGFPSYYAWRGRFKLGMK